MIKPEGITETPVTGTFTNGHTYQYYKTNVPWNTAKEFCEKQGGYLASITSAEEDAFVRFLAGDGAQFWLGATDTGNEGTWQWLTGESFSYTNWYSGEPNNSSLTGGSENFLHNSVYGKWNDADGSRIMGFVCEISDVESITETPVTGTFTNGHTYQYYKTNVPWNTAKEFCEKHGGYLASITSAEEDAFVRFLAGDGAQFWLGATDTGNEGTWQWLTGESFSYTNWYSGEPNNSSLTGGSENFLHNSIYGKWNDADGSRIMGFVCEISSFAINYDANGGTNAPAAQTATMGETVALSKTVPTREGHVFLGWASTATATNAQYQPGDSYKISGNATLYAVWRPYDYKIGTLIVRDSSGTELTAIPSGQFLVTIPVTKQTTGGSAMVLLASYTAAGQYRGLMYDSVEDLPVGGTVIVTLPVDNTKGDMAVLKAFAISSFRDMTPLGPASVFPAE